MSKKAKLKDKYDEIIDLNINHKIGYKKLAKMFNCSKSAIEWIVKTRSKNAPSSKILKIKQHTYDYVKKDLILEEAKRRQELENKKRLKKKQIKEYWSNNAQFGSNFDIILPIGKI